MKLFQSLKSKFILLFSLLIVILCSVSAIINIQEMERVASGIFSSEGFYLVERAAALIDGDAFEKLAASLNENDPYYENACREMYTLKVHSTCTYLYTMSQVSGSLWQYVIDGSGLPGDEEFSALGDTEDTSGYDDAFTRIQTTRQTEVGRLALQEDWGWMFSVYTPIFNSSGRMVGIIGCDFEAEFLAKTLRDTMIREILIGLGSLAIAALLLFIFTKMIFNRLDNINNILKEISSSEGDITHRITIRYKDEIGELATYFNLTLDKIKNLLVIVKDQASKLFSIGGELNSSMEQTTVSVDSIVTNIQGVKEKVHRQSGSVAGANSAMERITGNIDQLSRNVEAQSESVSRSSSAIEEMLANIQSVTRTLVKNENNVNELIAVSDEGKSSLQRVSGEIQEIARDSAGLLEINAVMKNIASQTNLLSMNAAIEAAHAGEAGRGFAVVADEIRKLAENAGQQSKTIGSVLKKIKTEIDSITVSTNTVIEKFQAIEERVRTVSDQEANIRSAMEEQGQGSQQILQAVGTLNEITQMVKQGSSEMLEGSKGVITESRNLEQATGDITASVTEMSEKAEQIESAAGRASEISNINKDYINSLFAELSKFKIE
ncbi:MAG: methyl-accepting chemotaxis protein [Treponema sp.]|nr:methyl-accepting chemotaxis protein [Treponema sp.]